MMWKIKRDGQVVDTGLTFRLAKQRYRELRDAEPGATWTVDDPNGRQVLPSA